jgi:hypothetical protein
MLSSRQLLQSSVLQCLVGALCLRFAFAKEARTPETTKTYDHLIPLQSEPWSKDYRHLYESKLAITPFDCGRAISIPSLGREIAVSVYSELLPSGTVRYRVSCIEPSDSLWQATDGLKHKERANNVKVRRCDAEISAEAALAIKDVWARMIKEAHRPKVERPPNNGAEVERMMVGYDLEFALDKGKGKRPIYGAITGMDGGLPAAGTKTDMLSKLYDALYDFCHASAKKRPNLAKKIEWDAIRLKNRL